MTIEDIALSLIPKISPKTARHLIECFGSAQNLFACSVDEIIARAELKPELAKELFKKTYRSDAEKEFEFTQKSGITPIAATDPEYPRLLKEGEDYPHVIYTKGNILAFSNPQAKVLSIVGTRKATEYGRKVCDKLIGELAEAVPGLIVVSGLASGIDAFAHRAAIVNNVPTFGVLGTPLSESGIVSDNRLMAKEMLKCGGIITEYHSNYPVSRHCFLTRNRIIAALSSATLVVEAPQKSGALYTAGFAHGYGREVFAVPGRIDAVGSFGPHNLISSEIARIASSAKDIIEQSGWGGISSVREVVQNTDMLGDDAKVVLTLLKEGETVGLNMLEQRSGLSSRELSIVVFELEMSGFIKILPGNLMEKK